jgi:HEAT repeat protein
VSAFADLAASLQKALKSQQMYGEAHPRAAGDLEALHQLFTAWLAEAPVRQVTSTETRLLVDGSPHEAGTIHTLALHRQLGERRLSGFMFLQGLRADELKAVLQLLILRPARIDEAGGAAAFLEAQGAAHVRLSQTRYLEVKEDEELRPVAAPEDAAPAEVAAAPSPAAPAAVPAATAPDAPASAVPMPGAPQNLVTLVKDALRSTFAERMSSDSSGSIRLPHLAAPGEAEAEPPPAPAGGEGGGEAPALSGFAGAGMGSVLNIIPAYLGDLGPMGYNIGLGEGMPTAAQMAVLRSALESLAPESQLSMLAGMPTLPAKPQGLALGIKELAGEILGMATVALLARNVPWAHLQGVLLSILRPLNERESMARALAIHMREAGQDGDLAEALLRHVQWDAMSVEARIVQVLEEGHLYSISLEQRLAFLRDLLDKGRGDAFARVLGLVFGVAGAADEAVRLVAAQTLRGVARWTGEPGLPPEAEAALAAHLRDRLGAEAAEPVHDPLAEAAQTLLAAWVARGELAQVQGFAGALEGAAAEGAEPWRARALGRLRARLSAPDLLAQAYPQLFLPDRDRVAQVSLPYFQWLGEDAMRYLVAALGQEKDRHWRGRLLELLRGAGPVAAGPLREALDSPAWYLARNALNLLADVGDRSSVEAMAPHLKHADPRVRMAAVRAHWKLLGADSGPVLAALLPEADGETRMEILFGLGQARAAGAAPAVLELALDRRAGEKLRLRALDTLPLLGGAPPVAALVELLQKKKGLFSGSEPFEIRLAAARSLKGIGSPEARWALQKAIEQEPKGRERDALEQILAGFKR